MTKISETELPKIESIAEQIFVGLCIRADVPFEDTVSAFRFSFYAATSFVEHLAEERLKLAATAKEHPGQ